LQRDGHVVERLILLDSYPPPAEEVIPEVQDGVSDRTWREIALGTDLTVPPEGAVPKLDCATISSLAQAQGHLLGTFALDQLEQLGAVMANNSRLFLTARPDLFAGDIDLFVATRRTPGLPAVPTTPDSWRPFCTGTIRAVRIDAEHHRMITSDTLEQIGRLLSDPGPALAVSAGAL
jgi:thioesterase domain-containing protein